MKVLLLLCSFAHVLAAQGLNGDASCPCLQSLPAGAFDEYLVGGKLKYQSYEYPADYGVSECRAWDEDLQPFCRDADGQDLPDRPEWCTHKFCYIDPNNCTLPLKFTSAYFPLSGLHYSFQTCGGGSTFSDWFEQGATTHQLTDLIQLMENYVSSIRVELETSYLEIKGAEENCPGKSSCPCDSCSTQVGWGQTKVDFSESIFRNPGGNFPAVAKAETSCLAALSDGLFSKIAAKEYDDSSRVGSVYQGFQMDGSYGQWPAVDWCPSDYDPRFRPWYSQAVSGPKDVVVVFDTSKSMMEQNRMGLARDAIKAVLDTLTWQDRVQIIIFANTVKEVSSPTLERVNDAKRESLKNWVDGRSPGGGTEFVAPLTQALETLATSSDPRCSKSVLFLTDGDAPFETKDYEAVQAKASANDIVLFGYALGSGADIKVTKQLACQNSGVFYEISDGSDLAGAMSGYFTYFAAAMNVFNVRWINYVDSITDTELLAACGPVYDHSGKENELSVLLGAVCMDINLLVSVEKLRQQSGYAAFMAEVEADTLKCAKMWEGMSDAEIARALEEVRLRLKGSGAHTCGNAPMDSSTDLIGIVVGSAAGVLVCVLLVVCVVRRRSQARDQRAPYDPNPHGNDALSKQQQQIAQQQNHPRPQQIEMEAAPHYEQKEPHFSDAAAPPSYYDAPPAPAPASNGPPTYTDKKNAALSTW